MNKLYGAILGDLAGQPYEYKYKGDYSEFNIHNPNSHITDDTIMTLATASYLLNDFVSYEDAYRRLGQKYINLDCFGKGFQEWLSTPKGTVNNSWGNGCLMRVSPCVYLNKEIALQKAIESCFCSHLNSDSIISTLNLMMLYKDAGLRRISSKYKAENHIVSFKDKFDVTAKGTIELITHAYYISNSTHETIEKIVKLGGDTDTNASIIGELMSYTFNDLTKNDVEYVESKLDSYLLDILIRFNKKFNHVLTKNV